MNVEYWHVSDILTISAGLSDQHGRSAQIVGLINLHLHLTFVHLFFTFSSLLRTQHPTTSREQGTTLSHSFTHSRLTRGGSLPSIIATTFSTSDIQPIFPQLRWEIWSPNETQTIFTRQCCHRSGSYHMCRSCKALHGSGLLRLSRVQNLQPRRVFATWFSIFEHIITRRRIGLLQCSTTSKISSPRR